MAASAESFDNRHSSSTFYGPGANSPLLSFQQVLFYRGMYNNRQTLMQSLTKPARIIIKILSYKVLKVKKNVRRQAPYKYNFAGLYS